MKLYDVVIFTKNPSRYSFSFIVLNKNQVNTRGSQYFFSTYENKYRRKRNNQRLLPFSWFRYKCPEKYPNFPSCSIPVYDLILEAFLYPSCDSMNTSFSAPRTVRPY